MTESASGLESCIDGVVMHIPNVASHDIHIGSMVRLAVLCDVETERSRRDSRDGPAPAKVSGTKRSKRCGQAGRFFLQLELFSTLNHLTYPKWTHLSLRFYSKIKRGRMEDAPPRADMALAVVLTAQEVNAGAGEGAWGIGPWPLVVATPLRCASIALC